MKILGHQLQKGGGSLFSEEFLNRLEHGNKRQQDLYKKIAGEYRLNKRKIENYLPQSKYVIDDVLLDPETAELVASSEFVINQKDIIKKFYYRFPEGFFLVTTTNGNKEFFTRVSIEEVKKQLRSDPKKYFEIFPKKEIPGNNMKPCGEIIDADVEECKKDTTETEEPHEEKLRFDFELPPGGFLFPEKYMKKGDV